MNLSCPRSSAHKALVATLAWAFLFGPGCGTQTDATTAVIVAVEWAEIDEVRHVLFRNRSSQLEIVAFLSSAEEVSCTRRISWQQAEQLTTGRAALTIRSNDGKFLDAWITVVPD